MYDRKERERERNRQTDGQTVSYHFSFIKERFSAALLRFDE